MLPSYLESVANLPAPTDLLPPSYEDTIGYENTPIPIITHIHRYAFIAPASFRSRNRHVGRRISTHAEPILISPASTFEAFVPALGDLAAEQFGWYDDEPGGKVAYALLLTGSEDGERDVVVTRSNWEVVKAIVIASSRGRFGERPGLVLAVGPVREVGVWERIGCWVLEVGRGFRGSSLP